MVSRKRRLTFVTGGEAWSAEESSGSLDGFLTGNEEEELDDSDEYVHQSSDLGKRRRLRKTSEEPSAEIRRTNEDFIASTEDSLEDDVDDRFCASANHAGQSYRRRHVIEDSDSENADHILFDSQGLKQEQQQRSGRDQGKLHEVEEPSEKGSNAVAFNALTDSLNPAETMGETVKNTAEGTFRTRLKNKFVTRKLPSNILKRSSSGRDQDTLLLRSTRLSLGREINIQEKLEANRRQKLGLAVEADDEQAQLSSHDHEQDVSSSNSRSDSESDMSGFIVPDKAGNLLGYAEDADIQQPEQEEDDENLEVSEHEYKIYLQFCLILACVDPSIDERLETEEDVKSYFAPPIQHVEEALLHRRTAVVASEAWVPELRAALKSRPYLDQSDLNFSGGSCEACGRANHPATKLIRLHGEPYNAKKLWRFDYSETREDVEAFANMYSEQKDTYVSFEVGRFCLARCRMFHTMQHYKHHLLCRLKSDFDEVARSEPSLKKASTVVEKILESPRLVADLFANFRRLIALAESYTTDSCHGHRRGTDRLSEDLDTFLTELQGGVILSS